MLKQYRLFCEEGYVNRELLGMSSGHVVFQDLQSMRAKKYVYSKSKDFELEEYSLCSDQSPLAYVEKVGDKYVTLSQLLTFENLSIEEFASHQQSALEYLLERKTIYMDENGYLRLNKARAYIIVDLFTHEVLCFAHRPSIVKQEIELLAKDDDLKYENTLLSRPEQCYLNFALNKSEFSNGWDLRNKYIHDIYSLNEGQQKRDYYELLKIMILIII